MLKFSFDFQKWVLWLLPEVLRQVRLIAFLNCLIAPIKWLHSVFLSYRSLTNEQTQTTGQVAILRGYLNRHFDPQDKRILIEDDGILPPVFIFTEAENRPLYLPVFLASTGGADFVVRIPFALFFQENQILAAVNKFKLVGKKFRIQYF